ncbi:MAG: 50S ribosomal protein L24 [Candidatus Nephthysia bennettiae]|uniref:Large ribosomal subunit protein uL24 n=1 Tax=Candidatus Nephthysia bennettiae TaxID=3127016 RepID=A0A934K962_9BACT|nr:50S ribosomal protein L24 [Candidatus Dormibacteraeota bacterium]MBJ7612022.1 50S ribosomal protein L24 [Candidatus Dormibacteraeota bacterium]PZR85644.1 MAG: 50S ribosomal protein L24 [Candidatus Dormibacteraeota bacterium]
MDLAPGDPVVVVAGKDRGKHGEVLRTLPRDGKVVVRGVNILKRHTKAGRSAGGNRAIQGGIVDFEAPLAYSNVMLVCPSCNRPTRIRHTVLESGNKAIECVKCGEPYERVRRSEAQ